MKQLLCFTSVREGGLFLLGTACAWLASSLLAGHWSVVAWAVLLLVAAILVLGFARITGATAVDVWESQEVLMRASGQVIPGSPTLTEGSVLYVALTVEELGEACANMALVLSRRTADKHAVALHTVLRSLATRLAEDANQLRRHVARAGKMCIPLSRYEAAELLDDVTDTAVTVAGMGLATGLPVRAGYVEVASSNLSKRNPDTLVIDKDSSGKWIKGSQYRPPNLAAVIDQVQVEEDA